MHPIERLRAVARSSSAPSALLAREAAAALAMVGDDLPGLVTVCRRLIARQPACAPLWWLSSRVLSAVEPGVATWSSADALERDTVEGAVAAALKRLPSDGGAPIVVRPAGLGAGAFVCDEGAAGAVARAHERGEAVWLVAPLGTALPGALFRSYLARLGVDPIFATAGLSRGSYDPGVLPAGAAATSVRGLAACPAGWAAVVVSAAGPGSVADALEAACCPVAPELLSFSS